MESQLATNKRDYEPVLNKKPETAAASYESAGDIKPSNAYDEWLLFDRQSQDEGRDSLLTNVG